MKVCLDVIERAINAHDAFNYWGVENPRLVLVFFNEGLNFDEGFSNYAWQDETGVSVVFCKYADQIDVGLTKYSNGWGE